MNGDDRDRDERPRRSWREIDQLRDGSRSGRSDPHQRPRSRAAQARAKAATQSYLKDAAKLFAGGPRGAEGERLSKKLREAHGSSSLAEVCREYRDALGMPSDPALLALFLDSDDSELVVSGLAALARLREQDALEVRAGLRSQLRLLAQSSDDSVAEAAEELLERL